MCIGLLIIEDPYVIKVCLSNLIFKIMILFYCLIKDFSKVIKKEVNKTAYCFIVILMILDFKTILMNDALTSFFILKEKILIL